MMAKLTALKPLWALLLFTLINVIFIGMGMGVPFFCILMGIPLGWFLVLYVTARTSGTREVMWKVLDLRGYCSQHHDGGHAYHLAPDKHRTV